LASFCNLLRDIASSNNITADDNENYDARQSSSAPASSDKTATAILKSQEESNNNTATSTWLYDLCSNVPTPFPTLQFAIAILSAITTNYNVDESKMQSSLFELFGEGEQSIEALFEVMGRIDDIVQFVTEDNLTFVAQRRGDVTSATTGAANSSGATSLPASTSSTSELENRLQTLRSEAYTAVDIANTLKTEYMLQNNLLNDNNSSSNYDSRGTHSVTRTSDKESEKLYKRAMKQASAAIRKARDAGALTESDEVMLQLNGNNTNNTTNNNKKNSQKLSAMEQMMLRNEEAMLYSTNNISGLDGMDAQQIQRMKQNLLPEGTREYNDRNNRGLPRGTIREIKEGYEQVIIPAPVLEKSRLRTRINLDEVLGYDTDERMAFDGCTSLNPMQSTVFEAAYNTRENLLICAPTGAGKTNVAMLTVVSHLRDVGLIGAAYHDDDHYYDNGPVSTGKKIVYIAPMKALAQEVVEKFSSKLKCLGIIVRELTGDMQLSRAEADAAHILVTTPEKWDVVTRKGGDGSLGASCGLLIIDEVHLLADERGAVIESVVARLHRWVESSQRQVRLVGL
jgi:superfamily II RNA helicase